jgi:hypothetical protein
MGPGLATSNVLISDLKGNKIQIEILKASKWIKPPMMAVNRNR